MSQYWQKRFEMLEDARNKTAKRTVQAITPAFDQAQAQIEKEINAWYARFAKNNEITLQEAKKLLNTKELKEFKWDVEEYIKYGRQNALDQKWMKELENASARFHISRLEALKIRTQNAAERAFGNELDQLDEMAARLYMDDYYHTAYEIQKGLGIGWDVGQIDQRKLDNLLSKPWTTDKMTFSDRIWKSKTQLVDTLHTELTRMCLLGKAPDQTINTLSKRMNVSKGQAGRLVMTEAAYFGSVAQKDAFNDLDVEKFEIVATLDNHTSEICQQMDGKVFDMKDFQAGVTAPPFHVWCRSCTCPWFEDNDDGTRAARGADGKTYQVPASMKYEDWKEYFVDKTKDPADWLKPAKIDDIHEFKEIKDALDFEYGNLTDKDYIKWMDDYDKHNIGVHLSKEELQIIDDYTEGSYIGLNDVCRYSDSELLKKGYSAEDIVRLRKQADILDGALSKYDLNTNIVTHRFERDVSWLTGNGNGIDELEKLIGTEYTTEGFTSSGMLPNRFRFTGGKKDAVHFEIVTPKGTNGAFLSMSKKGENEFLYNRNTKFRVLDGGERVIKEKKLNFKTMKMEEVDVTERFLKVQVIPDVVKHIEDVTKDIVEEIKEIKKFIPAKTIEEAEAFAKQFVDEKGFGAIGTSYAGVHLDVANEVNHCLSDVYSLFDIPKLGGIAAPAKNTKLGKMVNAHAAYSPIRKSILMDRNKTKKASMMLDGLMEDKKAITDILTHPEEYDFNKLSARLRKIIDASATTGRSIVAENIKEAITHELGHHIERSVSKDDWDVIKDGMEKYATKISGYCVDSLSEYFAESFTSYMKGESCIDPAVRKIFEKMRK